MKNGHAQRDSDRDLGSFTGVFAGSTDEVRETLVIEQMVRGGISDPRGGDVSGTGMDSNIAHSSLMHSRPHP